MNRTIVFLGCLLMAATMMAQVPDAATVYSDFSQQSVIVQTASPSSPEYQAAQQRMLQLFPMLQYHAAQFSGKGKNSSAMTFAKAYVDMAMMPQFEQMHLERSEQYPKMTYFVASNLYNHKDYTNAAIYLQRYIDIHASDKRAIVYFFLAQCYGNLHRTDEQKATLEQGLSEFPSDKNMLALAINTQIENGLYEEALTYIERALAHKQGDTKMLSLKGQCLEGLQQYEQAAGVYGYLAQTQKSLNIYKHYGLNLFNCAVKNYPVDKSMATTYLERAIPVLEQVTVNDPTSSTYLTALALAYLYTDRYDQLAQTNAKLKLLGAAEVGTTNSPALSLLASDIPAARRSNASTAANTTQPAAKQTNTSTQTTPVQPVPNDTKSSSFRTFAQTYIEREIQQWQQKDPFETVDEYKQRVTEKTRNEKVQQLMEEAKQKYIAQNSKKIRINDFQLQPYDAENRVFLIKSSYGDIVLPVPRENNEARNFANAWKSVRIENPKMDIAGDEMVIRSVDFVTHNGIVYSYSDKDERKYAQTQINMQFDNIDYSALSGGTSKKNKVQVEKNTISVGSSDVDINIPENKNKHNDRFAFIIGNENYQAIASVPFAIHDAQTMKKYCNKTLGIPDTNIRLYEDATFGQFLTCMRDIRSIADAYNGDIEIIFYYAGHGLPNEATKTAFLLPVDADGIQTEGCYSVAQLYQELGQTGARSVIVFMDACFSGSQRGEGMLASARGVALKAKPAAPKGRMVAFSAATGDETAFPYDEKQHGMFTYYLLKGLQNAKSHITLGELADFVTTNVKQRAVVINHKSQTPTVIPSSEAEGWQNWKLK